MVVDELADLLGNLTDLELGADVDVAGNFDLIDLLGDGNMPFLPSFDGLPNTDFDVAIGDANLSGELLNESPLAGPRLVYGDPIDSAAYFEPQTYSDTCAVVAQASIIEELTGQECTEESLATVAEQHGWYTPGGGTPPEHVGRLLECYGIQTERVSGVSVERLKEWLADGRKVIVGVDGDEIWNASPQISLNEMIGYPDAGHAVAVIGIEEDVVTGETNVILNDPGQVGGRAFKIPAARFVDAWDDCGRFACVTTPT